LSTTARRELIEAIRARYRNSRRAEKQLILREFVAITGYHRKSAIRALNRAGRSAALRATVPRVYDDAFRGMLVLLWEAADRICSKNLHIFMPTLVEALEQGGRLTIDPGTRAKLLAVSAATIDRLLREVRARNSRRAGRPASYRAVSIRSARVGSAQGRSAETTLDCSNAEARKPAEAAALSSSAPR
jgi:hypothetical protein